MSSSPVEDERYVRVRGDLFEAIQRDGVFESSKTFVDTVPRGDPDAILRRYRDRQGDPGFDLRQFVESHFALPEDPTADPDLPADRTLREHLRLLWDPLTRTRGDDVDERSTLLSLPYPYVAPGGRFSEIYYWDSYFTAVGLAAVDEYDAVAGMANNFATLVDRHGFVPNGSRVYYPSRSQPPVFFRLVGRLAEGVDASVSRYLPRLDAEYDFWMDGADDVDDAAPAHRRVVRLPDGSVLNRYWDDDPRPRPEAFDEDRALAAGLDADRRETLHRNVRAACESGWDFTSRWFRDGATLSTIRTTELLPVDLNALL